MCISEDTSTANKNKSKPGIILLETTPSSWPAPANEVLCLGFSRDGHRLAAGHGFWNSPGLARVWTLPEHKCIYQRSLPMGLSSVAFLDDSNSLAYTGWGAPFAVRNLHTGQSGPVMPFDRSVGRFALSPDGSRAVTATEGYAPEDNSGGRVVRIWNLRTGEVLLECESENLNRLMGVAYSPDGKHVAASGGRFRNNPGGRIYFWDATTGKLIRTIEAPLSPIDIIIYSPDGKQMASGSYNGSIRIWNLESGQQYRSWESKSQGIMGLAFSPDGKQLAVPTGQADVAIYSIEENTLEKTLKSDTGRIRSLTYSPDGKTLAGGTAQGRVILWNAGTGDVDWQSPGTALDDLTGLTHVRSVRESQTVLVASRAGVVHELSWADGSVLRKLTVGAQPITQLTISADAAYVAAVDTDGEVVVWKRSTGRSVLQLPAAERQDITSIALVGTPPRLATGNVAGQIQLLDLDTGQVVAKSQTDHGRIEQMSVSPTDKWLASAHRDGGEVRTWELPALKPISTINDGSGALAALAWSPHDDSLMIAGKDGRLSQWDAVTAEVRKQRGETPLERTVSMALTPDGQALASVSESGRLALWSLDSRNSGQKFSASKALAIEWSPDGTQLLAANGSDRLMTWQKSTSAPSLATLKSEFGNRVAAAFSPDGRWFASGGDDRIVTVHSVKSGEIAKVLQGHRSVLYNCEFSPDSRWLATGGLEGTVRIWATNEWRMRQAMPHEGAVRSLSFSRDGKWVATGTTKSVACIWEVETGRKLLELPDHATWVTGVGFAPDLQTFYSSTGSWDPAHQATGSIIKSWSIESTSEGLKGTFIRQSPSRIGSIECLRIFKDGSKLITSGTDSQVILWDPKTLMPLQTIGHDTPLHRGTLLPGDRFFVAGDVTGRIGLWELATSQRLRLFAGHSDHVFDVAASPDGEILASASQDDTIQFWSTTGREQGPPEWQLFLEQIEGPHVPQEAR